MRKITKGTPRPTLEALQARVRELGHTPNGCWEDDEHVYAFSAKHTPGGMYAVPRITLHWQAVGPYYTEAVYRGPSR